MMLSRNSLNKNSPHRSKYATFVVWVFGIVSILGFLDATYLAVEHFGGRVPPCSIVAGCDVVTRSAYATIGTIPVALLGSLYYLIFFILTIAYLDSKKEVLLRMAASLSILGFCASAYFVFLQFFVLKAICIYCMASAISSTILFIAGMVYLISSRKSGESAPVQDSQDRVLD